MRFSAAALTLALAATATAELDAVKILEEMMPNFKCKDTKECRTPAQSAPFIVNSMKRWQVCNPNAMAAIVSLMAFESGNFTYKHNAFPGRPGQGTANMQMANFNLLYAQDIPELKDKVSNITDVKGASNETLNYILSLVQPDEYNFGSGPWFYQKQCDKGVHDAMEKNADEGFAAYMKCVGVQVTDDRKAYFTRAKKAFGLA
ncbi:uncharacterized protein MAM_01550 [Metarhizium album ARSEF 1941]|uniref:Uncharacterized protein n=1 Tax=Metarhizium album (strain ARSEF 1941) TaxID=1081103 RepID=A0A0B2WX40_METAS|nr:uncharacterized protein MAM_01550 [Metarhizium album ARSEF 1941]KHO00772.1 hypothetical protein MAM_01550 [Metarhizium album ARSEF 1941]